MPNTKAETRAANPERQIQLTFEAPDGFVPGVLDAQAFPEFFIAITRALRLATEYLSGGKSKAEYGIVQLTYNSPVIATLEEVRGTVPSVTVSEATEFVGDVVDKVVSGQELPPIPGPLLRSIHQVATSSKRSNLVLSMHARSARSFIRPEASDRFDLRFNDDAEIDGTIEGLLQVLNVHGPRPFIRVWPTVGPVVTGRLPRKLIPKAKAAVDESVVVSGTLIYYPNENHPRRIRVLDIELVEKADVEPTFEALWGSGKHFRPDRSSLDLIQEMRSGWD